MKPVFKCDYCSFTGTKEEVKKHEPDCTRNYDMRSCYTCVHAEVKFTSLKSFQYKCNKEVVELPENHICKLCKSYERKEKLNEAPLNFHNIFGSFGF